MSRFEWQRKKQNIAVLVVASLVGVWLGATAPETSPVAPAPPAAAGLGGQP
jgi:hypothetical protein